MEEWIGYAVVERTVFLGKLTVVVSGFEAAVLEHRKRFEARTVDVPSVYTTLFPH